ncbi:mitochondrial 54S ribosomal protein YmL32 [Martiniozyma asiatica (nom. inval.)]|nr:mitochondrial 54S ribosomal protein YmL32 [Martiniozyma asiatica]
MASLLNIAGLAKAAEALVPRMGLPAISVGVYLPRSFLPESWTQETTSTENAKEEGILKAAPKKKVSHMRRRQRLYAPGDKQVKLKNNLNRCPACGHYKRSHHLCMNCVGQIRKFWKQRDANEIIVEEEFANPRDEGIIYPGKTEREFERKMKDESWWHKRSKTLPVENKK